MNYYEIGQRIRKYRKAYHYSQEELSEKVGISTTHMSHIETGNTKLSLSVLVSLSKVLEVQTDCLLFSSIEENHTSLEKQLLQVVEGCSTQQLQILLDILRSSRIALDKYFKE